MHKILTCGLNLALPPRLRVPLDQGTAAAEAKDLLTDPSLLTGTGPGAASTMIGGTNGKPRRKIVG